MFLMIMGRWKFIQSPLSDLKTQKIETLFQIFWLSPKKVKTWCNQTKLNSVQL